MQLSQKLKTIEQILISNKEREISYTKKYNLLMEDKINDKSYAILKEKYLGLNNIDGSNFLNLVGNN